MVSLIRVPGGTCFRTMVRTPASSTTMILTSWLGSPVGTTNWTVVTFSLVPGAVGCDCAVTSGAGGGADSSPGRTVTVTLTGSVALIRVPACGDCVTMTPGCRSVFVIVRTSESVTPTSCSKRRAFVNGCPITLGISNRCGPLLTTRLIVRPRSTRAPGWGSCSIMNPLDLFIERFAHLTHAQLCLVDEQT